MARRFETEEELLAAEEQRYNRHFSNRKDWSDRNKQVVNTTTNLSMPVQSSSNTRGRRVVIYWIDRETGGRVVDPMSVELDHVDRLPLSFIKAEWNCDNLTLVKGGLLLRPGPDGYSFQTMPKEGHLEFFAEDTSRHKRTAPKPHKEVELVCDLPAPNLPGMGLTCDSYVESLPMPPIMASTQKFCCHCGTKLPTDARFCCGCGKPV
eukprot:TRINITY_DN8228_c0_g1_i2.p1 TRINITY_DN8228_c0_g1~~TRINITY_DN8228_c0_g1_i2.p1  ORF type:complete len:207 (+),score=38.68 TRINITY_DN8228_c0_g1_i2:169-789(+)